MNPSILPWKRIFELLEIETLLIHLNPYELVYNRISSDGKERERCCPDEPVTKMGGEGEHRTLADVPDEPATEMGEGELSALAWRASLPHSVEKRAEIE